MQLQCDTEVTHQQPLLITGSIVLYTWYTKTFYNSYALGIVWK